MTDPSFAGQLIAFTYPHIGNYGVSAQAMESERPWARAAIMREACNREDAPTAERGWLDWLTDCGVQAISGVDTRALVKHIRDAGAMRGGVFAAEIPEAQARELIDAEPPMAGQDLARVVTPGRGQPPRQRRRTADRGDRHGHQGLDGARARLARRAGLAAPVHEPAPRSCSPRTPTRCSSPTGPATPPRSPTSCETRPGDRRGASPCGASASATSCSAGRWACETFKLPFGHRGANHPVRDLRTGRVEITSQNHGFAALGPGGGAHDRHRRAGALGDRLRRRCALARQPLRPHGRGPGAARRRRAAPCSTTPRRDPGRTTASTCSTASCSGSPRPPSAAAQRHPQDPDPRLRPDRDRAGRRVRLLGRPGLQGAARRGL